MGNGRRRESDLQSADEAIRRWGDAVWRLARARMGNQADAADAFQGAFLALCQAKPQFESLGHQKAWLLRVTINCCNQIARKRAAHPVAPLDGIDVASPEPEPGRDLELEAMLACLSDAQRTAVHLFYFEGYSTDDIAHITGERPATVRSHLYRARKTLRLELESERDGGAPC